MSEEQKEPQSVNPDNPIELKTIPLSKEAYQQHLYACLMQCTMIVAEDLYKFEEEKMRNREISQVERVAFRSRYKNNVRFEREIKKAHEKSLLAFQKAHAKYSKDTNERIDQLIGAMTDSEKEGWSQTVDAIYAGAQNIMASKNRRMSIMLLRLLNDGKLADFVKRLEESVAPVEKKEVVSE